MAKFSFKKPLAVLLASGTAISSLAFGFSTTAQAANNVVTVPNPMMTSLDPTNWGGQILIDQGTVMEGLYGYNSKNQIVPKIATGYTVSNAGKTWTFKLRHDAKWSNGDPVTAHDFVYAIMRLLAPSDTTGAIWASVAGNIVNGYSYHAGAAPASAVGIKALDNYTLQITTTVPHDLLGEMVISGSMPLDQKAVEAHPTDWWLPQNFVSDAPYTVKKFTPNGEVDLVRNPKYVGAKGETNVGNVNEIHIVPAPTVPVEAYMAKKLNVALIGSTSDLQYIKTHKLSSQLHQQPAAQVIYMQYDNSVTASPLDNPKVRQAVSMVINRDPIVKNVLSGMGAAASTFGGKGWAASKYEKGLPYNVAKAQQLLKEAGYPGGKGIPTLAMYCEVQSVAPQGVPVAEALAQEIKQSLGINFKIYPLASALYGAVTWGGMNQNILPGYNIASGVANWSEPANDSLQADQGILYPGTFGYSVSFRQHVFPWYTNAYNPDDVKKFGDPTKSKAGVSFSDWTALNTEAKKDIAWLDAWYNKQPQPYRDEVKPVIPLSAQWNQFILAWKHAKSDADKHSAFQSAWNFIAQHSTGAGNATLGLEGQVWWDQNESKQDLSWRQLQTEFENTTDDAKAPKLAGQLVTQLMQQGYVTPIYQNVQFFLANPNIHGVQTNPWSWGNFYQMQYLTVK